MKINKLTLVLLLLLSWNIPGYTQILQPVHWSYAAKRLSSDEAVVFFRAKIDLGWHIYGLNEPENGPTKSVISLAESTSYAPEGSVIAPKPIEKYETSFQMTVHYYENSVTFQQKVKLKAGKTTVNGRIGFMACNSQKCLPPDEVDFHVEVK